MVGFFTKEGLIPFAPSSEGNLERIFGMEMNGIHQRKQGDSRIGLRILGEVLGDIFLCVKMAVLEWYTAKHSG